MTKRLFLEMMLEILYPRRCPLCRETVGQKGEKICPACKKSLRPIREPACKKCGKPLNRQEQEYCADCGREEHLYTRGLAVLPYEGAVRRSMGQIKFHNKREYLDFYGPYMAEILGQRILSWKVQAIAPVPMHPAKKRRRGFNQAELLAEKLGECLGIPVMPGLVERVRATRPQKELTRRERQNNLKGAFKIRGYDVKLKKIILVDDIYTTGSTVDAIAGELLRQGAEEVYFASLCIGRDDSEIL